MKTRAPHPRTTTGDIDLGAIIRGHRNAHRMTQSALGATLGYSAPWVSRVEANEITPSRPILEAICRVLDLTPETLGITATPEVSATRVTGGQVRDDQEDKVRRRRFLAGAVGVSSIMITGDTANASTGQTPALVMSLFEPNTAGPLPLGQLTRRLTTARGAFAQARYQVLAEQLPQLIAVAEATRDSLNGYRRDLAHAVVAHTYILASELAVKAHSETAWVTADRALSAAHASGQAAAIGEAARMLAITMRRGGHAQAAVELLTHTARALHSGTGTVNRQALAIRTSLLLTASYSAAQTGDRTRALDLAGEAEQVVVRLGDTPVPGLLLANASPQQCELYRIGILNALGTPDQAVDHARRLNPALLPTAERRARYYTDTARMWHQLGDHQRTYAALCAVERQAPEEVRRPSLRALTADLCYSPVTIPGLKEFATRTGAISS